MRRIMLTLAVLAALPLVSALAAAPPPQFGQALSRQISSDGPRAAAWHLTLGHDWARVEQNVATNDPALSSATLRALLDYTPRFETGAMQHALRMRLQKDAFAGLAVLSPVARSPYSGQAICGAGEARWKHQVAPLVADTHDVRFALQREACVNALRLHSRR